MTKAEEAQRHDYSEDLPPPYVPGLEVDIPRQSRDLAAESHPPPPQGWAPNGGGAPYPPPPPPPAPGYNIFPPSPAPYAPPAPPAAPYSGSLSLYDGRNSGLLDRKSMRRQAINDARAARDARLAGLGLGMGGWRSQGQLAQQTQTQTQQTQGYVYAPDAQHQQQDPYAYTTSSRSLDLERGSGNNRNTLTADDDAAGASSAQKQGNGAGAKISSGVYAVVQYRADVMRARRDTRRGILGRGILAGRSYLLEKAAGAMSRSAAGASAGKGKGDGGERGGRGKWMGE